MTAPTLAWVDGFELQLYSTGAFTTGERTYNSLGNAAPDTSTFRTGAASLKINSSSAIGRVRRAVPAGQRTIAVSFYIYFPTSLPGSTQVIAHLIGPANTPLMQITSGGQVQVMFSTTGSPVNVGSALSANNWYLIDWKVDVSSGSFTMTARIDGGSDATATGSGTAADIASVGLGSNSATSTLTANYDDWVFGYTLGDYPIGSHDVLLLKPDADGSHNAGTNVIEDQSGTDIGAVTAFDLINEVPPESTDYIKQSASGSGNYAEVTFADPSGSTVWAVTAWAVMEGAAANAYGGIFRFLDVSNNVLLDIGAATGAGSGTSRINAAVLLPDPGADGWSITDLNGVKARVGFSTDVLPNPRFLTALLQYAVPGSVSATIDVPLATGTADSFTPAPTETLAPTTSSSTGESFAPTPSLGLAAPLSTGIADALAPSLALSQSIDVPIAAGIADGLIPALTGGTTIDTPMATATGDAFSPTPSLTISVPFAAVTADALAPALIFLVTVLPPTATATADALAPALVSTSTVVVPLAAATADAFVPTVLNPNAVPTATAAGEALVPHITATIDPGGPSVGGVLVASWGIPLRTPS